MDVTRIDPRELRKRMRLAQDIVVAHRVAKGLKLDQARLTASRDELEQRVLHALQDTDGSQMPDGWSWQLAVETLSVQIALSLVQEQKNEPRANTSE